MKIIVEKKVNSLSEFINEIWEDNYLIKRPFTFIKNWCRIFNRDEEEVQKEIFAELEKEKIIEITHKEWLQKWYTVFFQKEAAKYVIINELKAHFTNEGFKLYYMDVKEVPLENCTSLLQFMNNIELITLLKRKKEVFSQIKNLNLKDIMNDLINNILSKSEFKYLISCAGSLVVDSECFIADVYFYYQLVKDGFNDKTQTIMDKAFSFAIERAICELAPTLTHYIEVNVNLLKGKIDLRGAFKTNIMKQSLQFTIDINKGINISNLYSWLRRMSR